MKHRPAQSRLLAVAAVLAATLACYLSFPGIATTVGPQCSYDVLPGAKSYDAAGTSGAPDFVDVATPPGCPWTAVSNVDWLVITNGQDHVGPGNVAFLVQPNTGPPNAVTMARLGTMTIAGLTFTATQKGCSFSLDHNSKCFPSDGGPDSVQVTTGSATACTWFPVASAPWISIVGVVGPGNGHFDYAVAQNGPTARTATISVGDQIFVVNQDGVTSCAFPLSPLSQTFGADGGNGIINVSSPQCSPCSWAAVSNDPWIIITSGASTGQVRFSVTANTGFAARKGSISLAGQTFLISQSPATCDYSISPSGQSFSAGGGTGSIEMRATPGGCAWTVSPNANWIRVTSGGSGSGNATIGYSVDPNADGPARSGIITVADQKFAINQDGGGCSYTILPASAGFGAGGGQGDVAVNSATGCSWTALSNDSFILITSPTSGAGNGTVRYSVAANSGARSRTGTLTIAGQTLTISQAGTADSADLSVTVAGTPSPVAAGTRLTYQIRVSNAGPDPAVGVTISGSVPVGTTFDSIQSPGQSQTPSIGRSGPVTCSIASISSGGSATIELVVNVLAAPGVTLSNRAEVSSATSDPNTQNNSASASTPILGGGIVTLHWSQPAQIAPTSTPAPTNLTAGPGTGGGRTEDRPTGVAPQADAPCTLTGYNIYISSSQPVLTIPANLWVALPPTTNSQAPVGPAGSFYVVTSLWNCGGTIVESGLSGSGGSNETGVPAGPLVQNVKVGGKIKATGTGFTDSVQVFIGGTGFSRTAAVKNDNTLVIQKGGLTDGTSIGDVLAPGKTVILSFRNSTGGIGSFSFTQQ